MKLFLASEAKHPTSIRELKKFIGTGYKNKKVVYIPTAANGEYYGSWKGGGSIQTARKLFPNLKVIELEDYLYIDIIKEVKQSDILWIAGGMTGYLMYWIRRIKLDKVLPEILNSSTIYIGSSAGSMICAKTLYSAEWYIGEEEPGVSLMHGFGFIDFEIYPHYEDKLLPKIKKKWKSGKLCLLKNGEVVTMKENRISVIGKSRFLEK